MVRHSCDCASSGWVGLLRSLRDLSPLPAGPSRGSRRCHRPRPKPRADSPHDLIVSSRALVRELAPPLGDSSSHEIHSKPVCPPAGIPSVCPLPGAEAPFGPTVPAAESRSAFVVSHHHDGFLHTRVTGLLHPATGPGFAAFHASRYQTDPRAVLDTVGSPRDAVHTLRRLSLVSSRTASLRPLPSCRCRPPPGTPASRSRSMHRPFPTEAGSEQPRARPPRRVSHPTTAFVRSPPRGWAAARDGRNVQQKRGTGSECDDAPIRRSGPPRHRARVSPPDRSRERRSREIACRSDSAEAPPPDRRSSRPAEGAPPRAAILRAGRSRPEGVRTTHRNRGRGSLVDLRRRRRSDANTGPGRISLRSWLQGLAPLTSPSCHAAVASDATLVPSMGFVPIQGPLNSALPRRCQIGGGARPGRSPSAHPRPFPRRSKLRRRPGGRIPPEVHPPPPWPKP